MRTERVSVNPIIPMFVMRPCIFQLSDNIFTDTLV
jgi:hypothetical protein